MARVVRMVLGGAELVTEAGARAQGVGGGARGEAGAGGGVVAAATWHSTGALAEQLARAPAKLAWLLHNHVLQVVGGDGGG